MSSLLVPLPPLSSGRAAAPGGRALPAQKKHRSIGITTSLWCIAVFLVWDAAGFLATAFDYARVSGARPDDAPSYTMAAYLRDTYTRADSDAIIYWLSFAPIVAFVLWIARRSGAPLAEHFPLKPFRIWDLLAGVGLVAVSFVGLSMAYDLAGLDWRSSWAEDLHKDAVRRGWLIPSALTFVVGAPVLEEMVFRGVLFRGWAASRIGPAGAVVLTSALFTGIHAQYTAPELAMIFCDGLVLGLLRHRSGSLLLPMALHALVNLYCVLHDGTLHGFGS